MSFSEHFWGFLEITRFPRMVGSDQERAFWKKYHFLILLGRQLVGELGQGAFSSRPSLLRQWDDLPSLLITGGRRWLLGGEMDHCPKPRSQVISLFCHLEALCIWASHFLDLSFYHRKLKPREAGQCPLEIICGSRISTIVLLLQCCCKLENPGGSFCLSYNSLCICPCGVCARWLHL